MSMMFIWTKALYEFYDQTILTNQNIRSIWFMAGNIWISGNLYDNIMY